MNNYCQLRTANYQLVAIFTTMFTSKNNDLEFFTLDGEREASVKIPLFETPVSAGFPSPTDSFVETELDLNTFLVKHPSSTFCVKVKGQSMINAGIRAGDILIVDRAANPQNNSIVIALVDGDFTVKRITKVGSDLFLMPENESYKPIQITENMKFEVWGVVTYIIKKTV